MSSRASAGVVNPASRVLLVSSDPARRRQILESLQYHPNHIEEAYSGAHALSKLKSLVCDNVYLDRELPDLDANEIAGIIGKRYPELGVHLVGSRPEGTAEQAVAGASPTAPPFLPSGAAAARESNVLRNTQPMAQSDGLRVETEPLPGMIGSAPSIRRAYELARLVAPRNTAVLITGETGTGKEVLAQGIHQIGPRSKNPFVVVNCAAIPEALLEAELFGHVRGAFTGAVQSRLGRIHSAHDGTLFLDEVGDLPLSMQAKLLRFLQGGEVQRLGSSDVFRVDVRVICATNARLPERVREKLFREDLYYRLAVFPIEVPPLRSRREDITELARHFLTELSGDCGSPQKVLAASAQALLRHYSWPGNVRELRHAVERAFILSACETQLRVEHFSQLTESGLFREI